MQNHVQFGYPTPPASPSYDNQRCHFQQPQPRHYQPARCIPLAPEERLGRLLEGKLQLTEILGTGAYGVVYSAVDVKTGIRYAIKCLSKYNPDGTPLERRQVAYQQREIRLHYLASAHCNVVSILKIVDDMDCMYVVLEYCPEGDLFLNITERGQYVGNDALAKKAFLQILDAVEHCHKLGIYHRDLKPENILVTDNAETVKLADFGLATSDDRSEDYGCGSTFYMSPECLDPSTRRPYYMCAPNDVWSLGVILVNLTCGRNPWKQASVQDSTYRAYVRSPGFLKTILPLSDELNDILGRIFHPNPEFRVTLSELRCRIMACSTFTVQPGAAVMPSPPASPEQMNEAYFAANEDAIIDDYDYDAALSPASTSSEEGSLTSSVSSLDELDEDLIQDEQDMQDYIPHTYDTEDLRNSPTMFQAPEFVPQQYTGPIAVPGIVPSQQPIPCQQVPLTSHAPVSIPQCQQPQPHAKSFFPLWEVVRLVQQAPIIQHSTPFHQQVPFLPTFQGY